MSIIESSLVFRFLNKLDIQEESIQNEISQSAFIKMKLSFLDKIQAFMSGIAGSSQLVKYIDYLILLVITLNFVAITFTSTGIIGLLIVLAFCLLLIKFFCVKGERHNFTTFDIPVFLYMVISGLAVTFSSLLLPSMKGYAKMLIYFGGYLTFINIFKNHPKRIIYLMSVLAVTASLEAFYAVYQQMVGIEALASWQDETNANPEQLMNRVYGTLKPLNPNLLAGYLVAGFSSALGMTAWFLYKKNWRAGIAFLVGTGAILLAILYTGSRGAYLATAGMMFVFVLISGHIIFHEYSHIKWLKKLWLAGIILSIAAVIGLIIISPSVQHRVLSIFALRADSSNSYRMNVYASCIKMFMDNWLIGIGPGNTTFRLIYGLYMVTGFDALGAYSVPIEVAVETGIFGFLAFLWLILLSYIRGAKYIFCKDSLLENKIIVSSCIIGITGLMVHGLVDTVWYRPQINIIFWLLIAILAIITMKKKSSA